MFVNRLNIKILINFLKSVCEIKLMIVYLVLLVGTYLQDLVFYYQFVDQERAEIRDPALFECAGAEFRVTEN